MTNSQGIVVAEIATTFTDKAQPTSAEILAALNRAYQAGFAEGVIRGSSHTAEVMDRVMLRMAAP